MINLKKLVQDEKEKDFRIGMPGAEFLLKLKNVPRLQIAYLSLCNCIAVLYRFIGFIGINDCLSSKHIKLLHYHERIAPPRISIITQPVAASVPHLPAVVYIY
ncbi:hypothetical protein PIB30_038763 [Stylosanthes scabra]|uniref:Uncharacterized protein n=1 Tax=Stylosanthes scabra TaxID=79078 RepID=A0ABU6WE90_9FABA|nr:hypothetical protein [Stylosanthes scabra]